MVSAFQSRELGFGLELTETELGCINYYRETHRPFYVESESAVKVNGGAKKNKLEESPFVKFFEYGYGAGKEGYWTYDHMAVQFEDCVDCIQALYPNFDSVWMFDHSCGHDRGREDGLIVSNMSVNWGGKQAKVRSSEIKQEQGFLGPHSPKLQVGSIQHMVFQDFDEGPYYLPPNLQQIRKHDEVRGKKVKNRLKKDLSEDIEKLGFSSRGKTLKEMQEIASSRNIPLTIEEDDVVEGWLGKPKGLRQILWERGLLDPSVQYVAKIKKDDPNEGGKVEYSSVLNNCTDFMTEKTCLMYLGERLDVEVDRSTKCHPELAGEGIEYTWGRAKGLYRKSKLSEKKGKDNFRSLVQKCLSTKEGKELGSLTPTMIRKFSRRARQYIQAYYWIEHGMEMKKGETELSEANIEKVKREFKTHRNAIDFDEKFINHCFAIHEREDVSRAGSSRNLDISSKNNEKQG